MRDASVVSSRSRIWLTAALLTAISWPRQPSPAADDAVVGQPDASSRLQPAASLSDRDQPRAGPFVVSLTNGDRLTGRILALDGDRLRFRPDVARESELAVQLPRIASIERSRGEPPVEPRGDRVYPLAGGVIHGTLCGVTPQSLTIDAHLVGRVQLPSDTLAAFVREDHELPHRSAAAEFHQILDRTGGSLIGTAAFTTRGLTISQGGETTTLPLREVEAILFPWPDPAAANPKPPGPAAGCVVKLLNGGELVGAEPAIDRDLISVAIAGGGRVAVPIDHMDRLHFGAAETGVAGPRRVVFWSACADADEEARHMAEALAEGLPQGWQIDAEAKHPHLADLEADLLKAGVLVVPEMEQFSQTKLPEPDQLGRVLRAFLERGGTVVLAGVGDAPAAYWKAAGLVSLTSNKRVNKAEFSFTEDTPLAAGVGQSFAAVNATYEYQTDDEQLRPVASRDDGGAAVLVKRVGVGSLVVLGMDYYASSAAVNRVLVNAVTLRHISR